MARLADSSRAEEFERLRPIAEEIVAASERGDLLAYVDADLRFHVELLSLCGNAHLVSVVRDLRNRARLYGLSQLSERGTLGGSAREHLELLDALSRGDSEAVGTLMAEHIGHVRGIWAEH